MKADLSKKAIFALTTAGVVAAYVFAVRPWHLRWGATDEELTETLPGDEVKLDAGIQVTHAITIDVPAPELWKWLVQIGQDRGGFYSYDWIENLFGLQIQNTDAIKPEFQDLKLGDFVRSARKGWLGGKFDDTAGWYVVGFEPARALVLRDEIEHGSWAFVLRPVTDNQTRLIVRVGGDAAESVARKALNLSFFEPAHFIMERKMMLTLKERAEASFALETKVLAGAR